MLNNALSGVDQALWDIKGKVAGLPLYQLLGGKVREGAAVYRHADGRDPQEVLDNVLRLREEGYRHIRCQMGGYGGLGSTARPPARRAASRAVLRPRRLRGAACRRCSSTCAARSASRSKLLHDVHERLAPIDAVRLAKALEPYRAVLPGGPAGARGPGLAPDAARPDAPRPSRWASCSPIRSSGGR